jgi:hypothetical protein
MEIYYVASFSSRWKHITCHRLLSDTWDFEKCDEHFFSKKTNKPSIRVVRKADKRREDAICDGQTD